jgi:hypothetical protein
MLIRGCSRLRTGFQQTILKTTFGRLLRGGRRFQMLSPGAAVYIRPCSIVVGGCEVVSSPHHQGGPRKASQNSFTAAATAPLMMSRRSGESILSSSSRLMIEPASRRTAGIRVDLSTKSSS